MRYTLPQGVQGPFFNDDFGDVYGVIYALQAKGFSYAELKTLADDVRQQLLQVPDVAKVEQFGVQDEKVYVELSHRATQMGLNLKQVLDQLNQQNAVASAGTLQTPAETIVLRVQGQFNDLEQLRAMPIIGQGGAQFRLGDIAEVHRGYADPANVMVRFQGEPTVALGVSMVKGGDIIAWARR
jgi:multidrug efflux pump subunit AcrB